MSLQNWLSNGWIIEHKTSPQEIADLLAVADRDLKDCLSSSISPDWQLAIAYNAALQLSTAALAASGYRASREAHHYRIIQSLAHTIKEQPNLINQLDKFRKKRNIGGYEVAGMTSQKEADEMKALAQKLQERIVRWLQHYYPDLIGKKHS
jgi:hypothetical protein